MRTEGGESRPLSTRLPWIVGTAVVLALLAVARIDHTHTERKIPPRPTSNAQLPARYERIQQLDRDFDRRAWIYGGIAAVAMALAAAAALAQAPTLAGQRRVFAQGGVIGVVLGLLGVIVVWWARDYINPPTAAVFAPSLTLLALAAVGGMSTRVQRPPAGEAVPQEPRPLRRVAQLALACTLLTVLLAVLYGSGQRGTCDAPATDAVWASPVAWAAVISAVAAFVLGLAGLAARRWFVALVCVVVNPMALFYMVLSTGALCG
jgi:hypothetical protein